MLASYSSSSNFDHKNWLQIYFIGNNVFLTFIEPKWLVDHCKLFIQ